MKRLIARAHNITRERGFASLCDETLAKLVPGNLHREKWADLQFRRRELPTVDVRPSSDQHVLLLVVDALRADAISADDTPFLNEFTRTSAVAASPWTYPSISSLFTGLYPHEHGAMRQNDDPDNVGEDELRLPPKIPEELTTLSEYFAGAGYRTFGSFAFYMPFLALSGRFETHKLHSDADASGLFEDYLQWIERHGDERTFSYLHVGDLHEPIDPPQRYWEEYAVDGTIEDISGWGSGRETWDEGRRQYFREHKQRLYRAAARYVDDQIETLLEELNDVVGTDPVLIVTGDHGEAFWEHASLDEQHFYDSRLAYCLGHGGTPFESVSRVPIIGNTLEFGQGLVSLVDIFPTLLAEFGVPYPERVSGIVHPKEVSPDRTILIEGSRYGYEKKATYRDRYKIIHSKGDDVELEFALPEETLTEIPPGIKRELRAALPPWPGGGGDRQVSKSVESRLESLGYK